jgi:DNA-binding beta-propeller fold protein YncE
VPISSGFDQPLGIAVDSAGNVFVTDDNENTEIAFSNGSYDAPVSIGSGFSNPTGVAVDASANVFDLDTRDSIAGLQNDIDLVSVFVAKVIGATRSEWVAPVCRRRY